MKLSILKALILSCLIAIPHETKCDWKDSAPIAGLFAIAVAVYGGICWYYSKTDEQVVAESFEMIKRLKNQHDRTLKLFEEIIDNVNCSSITEDNLEKLIKQGLNNHLSSSYSYQIGKLNAQYKELEKRIKNLKNKDRNFDQDKSLALGIEVKPWLESLIMRFEEKRDIFEFNKTFINFYVREQELVSKYKDELKENVQIQEILSGIVKSKASSSEKYPLTGAVENLKNDLLDLANRGLGLEKYPNAKSRHDELCSKLKFIKKAIVGSHSYSEEKLKKEKEEFEIEKAKFKAEKEEIEAKERKIERKEAEQFWISWGQDVREFAQTAREEDLIQKKVELENERKRILKQAKIDRDQTTDRETRAAGLAAKAGLHASNKIKELKDNQKISVNPERLDIDQIVLAIEQEEFDMARKSQPDWYYEDAAVKERSEQKAVRKLGTAISENF